MRRLMKKVTNKRKIPLVRSSKRIQRLEFEKKINFCNFDNFFCVFSVNKNILKLNQLNYFPVCFSHLLCAILRMPVIYFILYFLFL